MYLKRFTKQMDAAEQLKEHFGYSEKYENLKKDVILAICAEKKLSNEDEIKKLSPRTKLISQEVIMAYKKFSKYCRDTTDDFIDQMS